MTADAATIPSRRAPARRIRTAGTRTVRALAPVIVALVIGALVLVISGKNPFAVYGLLANQAFGSTSGLAGTLSEATPLLLTGLGSAICFRAGFFNVGLEGSVYVGALTTAWVASTGTSLPGPVLVAAALIGGLAAGLAWAIVPAALRAYLAIDEVVTTLMLNYVAIGLTNYIVLYHYLYGSTGNAQSPPIAGQAALEPLVSGTTFTAGFFIALAAVLVYGWMLRTTRLGFHIRTVGDAPRFADAIGIPTPRTAMVTMLVGGAAGGLAGALVVLGVTRNFTAGFSTAPGYGYTGIAVAVLARNSWVGIILGSLFFGALASGGALVQLFSNVPIALTQVLQGALMIFSGVTVASWWFNRYRSRRSTAPPGTADDAEPARET